MSTLDPVSRASIEILACNRRDVYPAGSSYHVEILENVAAEREAGRITGDEAAALIFGIYKFVNGEAPELHIA